MRWVRAALADQRLSTAIVLVSVVASGFVAVWLGYRSAAAIGVVPFQVPYVVSGGVVGIALIGTGLALLSTHLSRVEAAEERRALAELQREAVSLLAVRAGDR